MSFDPIPLEEFKLLLAEHVLRLDAPTFAKWERLRIAPQLVPCERHNQARETIYSVAREADDQIIYDDVEEEFGVGHLDADGVLRNWSTVGDELRWALAQFPPTPEVSRPSA